MITILIQFNKHNTNTCVHFANITHAHVKTRLSNLVRQQLTKQVRNGPRLNFKRNRYFQTSKLICNIRKRYPLRDLIKADQSPDFFNSIFHYDRNSLRFGHLITPRTKDGTLKLLVRNNGRLKAENPALMKGDVLFFRGFVRKEVRSWKIMEGKKNEK